MAYEREKASGESLIWLENSKVLREFNGIISRRDEKPPRPPTTRELPRDNWWPRRVFAIDGSNITHRVNNGFPGAEAGLVMISVVAIKLDQLRNIPDGQIPRPSVFHNMESAATVESALPGIGVVRRDKEKDDPVDFFRQSVFDTISGSIAGNHETLLETLRSIARDHKPTFQCPGQDCIEKFLTGQGAYLCACGQREQLFETDMLRLHEYFDGVRSSGEAHGRLRSALEILVLLNILRYFANHSPKYFADCAFVLDGPLAVFGTPASILTPIRKELRRLNDISRKATGKDIAVFGIEKTGAFMEHWEQIDWNETKGPRTNYKDGTVVLLGNEYIRENIKPGKTEKPFGADTHFGRAVLYKTKKGEHVVLNTPMHNEASRDFSSTEPECYPRLGDILDVIDQLATYLYHDGFLPLIRAHANAAIPLRRGSDIIKTLLEE